MTAPAIVRPRGAGECPEGVRLGGLVQLTVRVKPVEKKRNGRNPATGEEIDITAKPASVDVRARPLAKAMAALPSVEKARRRLADRGRPFLYQTAQRLLTYVTWMTSLTFLTADTRA